MYEEEFYPHAELIAIAIDIQGSQRVAPLVRQAGLRFPALIDTTARIPQLLGAKSVPVCIFLDEDQYLRWVSFRGFDIRQAVHLNEVRAFVAHNVTNGIGIADSVVDSAQDEALKLFIRGWDHFKSGEIHLASECWEEASHLAPENRIIQEQLRAIRDPESFYDCE